MKNIPNRLIVASHLKTLSKILSREADAIDRGYVSELSPEDISIVLQTLKQHLLYKTPKSNLV